MEQSSRIKTVILLIILIAVAVAGLFWLTLRRIDPSWLISLPDLYAQKYSADLSEVETLRVDDVYNDILLQPAKDSQLHIEYLESSYERYLFAVSDESLICRFIPGEYYLQYGLPLRSGDSQLVIYLPATYQGSLDLATLSGDINVTLPGHAADYTLQAATKSGTVSLAAGCGDGEQLVRLSSGSGDITVSFSED
jgi:hypothetical protein